MSIQHEFHRRCPWWLGYVLINPLRRWRQDPKKILGPYVREGMTVLEPGPGMGFFTLELARLVGPTGRVVAVDVQQRMLTTLGKRAAKAGLRDRLDLRLVRDGGLGVEDLAGKADFALAFAMVHEVPDPARLFREIKAALKPGGILLLSEPSGHVKEKQYAETLDLARAAGFTLGESPAIALSRSSLLR
ncbi:MAG: methyltransferase domain-containing protein [Candidatus Coatesbacteria bacterium]